jgi:hypothetical protein
MASPEKPIPVYAEVFDTVCDIVGDAQGAPADLIENPAANARMAELIRSLRSRGLDFYDGQDLIAEAGAEHGRMRRDNEQGVEGL